jgi:hypothetical protein
MAPFRRGWCQRNTLGELLRVCLLLPRERRRGGGVGLYSSRGLDAAPRWSCLLQQPTIGVVGTEVQPRSLGVGSWASSVFLRPMP